MLHLHPQVNHLPRTPCPLISPHPCRNTLRSKCRLSHGLKHAKPALCNRGYATTTYALQLDNRELLVGDCVSLVSFALWKQIAAIILLPTFPGWLAPLTFNPLRFIEFGAFAATLCGTWVACATILGGYKMDATSDLPTALRKVCLVWLISQPVAAAELVLLTAAEGSTLVGVDGFASVLPLAASGPGEPFVTTAGVLGLMAVWRCWYTAYLDIANFRSSSFSSRIDREKDARVLKEALLATLLLAGVCAGVVWAASALLRREELAMLLF